MRRSSRMRSVTTASWRVLRGHPALLALSVAAGLVATVVALVVVGGGYLLVDPGHGLLERPEGAMVAVYVIAGVAAGWIVSLGQGAVVIASDRRLAGEAPAVGAALSTALRRAGPLLAWTAVESVVTSASRAAADRGSIAGWLLGVSGRLGFAMIAFLALPVLMLEGVGVWPALRRSAQLLRESWGERLRVEVAIGGLGAIAVLPALVLAAVAGTTDLVAPVVAGLVAGAWILLVSGILTAVTAVAKTALYRAVLGRPLRYDLALGQLEEAFTSAR